MIEAHRGNEGAREMEYSSGCMLKTIRDTYDKVEIGC
jgi:hypothetical protein